MYTTVLNEIIAFLLGRKYYANVIATKGVATQELCSYIFTSKAAALNHRRQIESTLSYSYVTTVSFRSRKISVGNVKS